MRNIVLLIILALPGAVPGAEGELISYIPFSTVAPQDIAHDEEDGTYWITAFLENRVYHFAPGLRGEIDGFQSPLTYPTGIAYNSTDRTLLVAAILSDRIVEVWKDGTPTGREIVPALKPVVNPNAAPAIRGMAFDRTGDEGRGSIYLVETLGTLVYEVALDGRVIREFIHPDDPDGYPGRGQSATTSDIDLIYEGGILAGFYVTGGRGRVTSIRRLDVNGAYTGISIPIEEAGGNVSGILRRPFERPDTGDLVDSYLCVVESNARFALLQGGEPSFHEILDFQCESSAGVVSMTWRSMQEYDGIEILQGCNRIEALPGNATGWRHSFPEGVHELTLRAFQGSFSTSPPSCTVVAGPGEVVESALAGGTQLIDIASDGGDLLLATDALEGQVLIFDRDFLPLGTLEVSEAFAAEDDYVTGIAYAKETGSIFLFNASQSMVGVLDEVGALVAAFPANLPNLEDDPEKEPDLGFVLGMAHDPGGGDGRGSLWLLESVRDHVYEIDLDGNVINDFPHPYLAIDPPPPETPYGIYSSGIALSGDGPAREIILGGGTLRDLNQPHVFRADPWTGEAKKGSAIPTQGIRKASTNAFFTFDVVETAGEERLVVLTIAGKNSKLLEVLARPSQVPPPTFFSAKQPSQADEARLQFANNGPYDRVEVFRDCEEIARIPGDASSYTDTTPAPGIHEYAVRGVVGGLASDFARASLRIGAGAILERAFLWPARSPQQLTRDPATGNFIVSVNWPGEERKLYFYDSRLQFLSSRDSAVQAPWQIAALAVRAPEGESSELAYITWQLPVPIGDVASQRFFLVREGDGGLIGEGEIFPPRPTNGFITFPTGLAWDPRSDTFFYLERNSKTFVQMAADGTIVNSFPHPAPPFQNFVFNLGLDVVPERGSLFITGSDKFDYRVTKVREMTSGGELTGTEIPLANLGSTITGITIVGGDLVAVGTGSFSEIFRIKAFPENDGFFREFLRGDVDGNETLNITDAVFILSHLFRGGDPPACEDASDADDNGRLDITDAIGLLLHLFQGGAPLPPPYPDRGTDPTSDELSCFAG